MSLQYSCIGVKSKFNIDLEAFQHPVKDGCEVKYNFMFLKEQGKLKEHYNILGITAYSL